MIYFKLKLGATGSFSAQLTGERAGQDFGSQAQAAVPALGKDAEVARHDGHEKLVHDRRVLVHVSVEQLKGTVEEHYAKSQRMCVLCSRHSPIRRNHRAASSSHDCRY